jgi:TrmH family RNA methyltransferase
MVEDLAVSRELEVIRSRSNACLKRVGGVLAGKEPETLVLEGERLVRDALGAGLALELLLLADDREVDDLDARDVRVVEAGLLGKVSALKTSPGVLALCAAPVAVPLAALAADARALVLVVAGVGDPGNLGALARAAEAAGATALVCLAGGASPWHPRALRGSMGSLLRLPVVAAARAEEVAATLAARGFRGAVAATRGGARPTEFDWSGPLALWVTGETGEAPFAAQALEPVTIPIAAPVESLNVTVAAALLLFAAGRVGGAP